MNSSGAERVSAYVTHGVFPNESWKRFLGGPLHRLWLTDSVPTTAGAVSGKMPFEVLSTAPLLLPLLLDE